jgi:hypothetical protein
MRIVRSMLGHDALASTRLAGSWKGEAMQLPGVVKLPSAFLDRPGVGPRQMVSTAIGAAGLGARVAGTSLRWAGTAVRGLGGALSGLKPR